MIGLVTSAATGRAGRRIRLGWTAGTLLPTVVAIFLVLLPSPSAGAATEYEFTVTSEGSYSSKYTGRIVVDGQRWRMDLGDSAVARAHDSVFQARAGHVVALNHGNHTWYELVNTAALRIPSLFDFHRNHPTRALELKVESLPTVNAAEEAKSFRYKTRVDIGGETIGGAISGRLVRVKSPDVADPQPMALLFSLTTGTQLVDRLLEGVVLGHSDPPSRVELTILRQFDGGAPMTQVIRWTVTRTRTIATDSAAFEVPSGYTNQTPQIGSPG